MPPSARPVRRDNTPTPLAARANTAVQVRQWRNYPQLFSFPTTNAKQNSCLVQEKMFTQVCCFVLIIIFELDVLFLKEGLFLHGSEGSLHLVAQTLLKMNHHQNNKITK
jgi:hypothetical protein